jgi:hypothetical protein
VALRCLAPQAQVRLLLQLPLLVRVLRMVLPRVAFVGVSTK